MTFEYRNHGFLIFNISKPDVLEDSNVFMCMKLDMCRWHIVQVNGCKNSLYLNLLCALEVCSKWSCVGQFKNEDSSTTSGLSLAYSLILSHAYTDLMLYDHYCQLKWNCNLFSFHQHHLSADIVQLPECRILLLKVGNPGSIILLLDAWILCWISMWRVT